MGRLGNYFMIMMERNGINGLCDDLFGFLKENRLYGKIENKKKN